ncbi:hypothetical protein [Flagellimonas oceanensis]|mgnify:CR=1 FL=1|uniref:hypothetical protein n=1 Tax=Flagellimonas oceanensis TaxID=2499163 RepID=UPI000F8DF6B7|nr:hypothetical protein [Allomuricauda oceanensis]|tara:strand:+ start:2564 stop:2950 length:387 start_codon:yes stop_codon:yes gene_type:complete
MMGLLRNSVSLRVFWALMSLYLLNISVDSPDQYPDFVPEDLTINDQESMIEILVEKVLGYGDVFEEYDDPDKEDHNSGSSFKIKLTFHKNEMTDSNNIWLLQKKKKFHQHMASLPQRCTKLETPPPEA